MLDSRVELDDRLVAALQDEPRATVLSLADVTGFPRAVVATRLKELTAAGDLRIVAATHPQVSGARVVSRVSIAVSGPVTPIVDFLSDFEEVVYVATVTGYFEIVAEVRVSTHEDITNLLGQFRACPGVERVRSMLYTGFTKSYLSHTELGDYSIDATDRQLIEALGQDGRMSWQELANIVGLSPSAVRTRVNRIFNSGIARIIVMQRGGRNRNVSAVTAGLTLASDAAPALERLSEFPEVEFAISTLGDFDAIIVLRARDMRAIYETLERIRTDEEIVKVETWALMHAWKEDFSRLL